MIAAFKTDIGKVRKINQDTVLCYQGKIGMLNNLFAVADGMGGAKSGDKASRMLIDELTSSTETSLDRQSTSIIRKAIDKANLKVLTESRREASLDGMGSTLVLATIDDNKLLVANVGDSRLYIINSTAIRQVTKDHSYVEEMVRNGALNRDSADYKKKKHIITRAVGMNSFIEADFFEEILEPEDIVLLCSDGLTNMLSDDMIQKIVLSNDLETAADQLITKANEAGGTDNISVILIGEFGNEVRL